jgi:hypothetical protein
MAPARDMKSTLGFTINHYGSLGLSPDCGRHILAYRLEYDPKDCTGGYGGSRLGGDS